MTEQYKNPEMDHDEAFSLEEAFGQLDHVLEQLQSRELPLSDAVEAYQKGVELCEKCRKSIDMAEKKVIQLQGEENGLAF